VNVQDELALDRAYAHLRSIRAFLKVERRTRGQKAAAPKARPLSAEKLEAILSAVVAAYGPRERPTAKDVARVCGITRDTAMEARRILCVAGRWPNASQQAEIASMVSRATTLQAPSTSR
jgi:hypothetical protein